MMPFISILFFSVVEFLGTKVGQMENGYIFQNNLCKEWKNKRSFLIK